MKQVTIMTHSHGPVQVNCHYTAPGGVFCVTPSTPEDARGSKWTVTHIPTGRQCIARGARFEYIKDAKVYARSLNEIFGPIQTACITTKEQINQLNRLVGKREFKLWEPGDPDYPCADPTVLADTQ